jgi:hypothetical protein
MADGSPSGTGATSTTVAPFDGTISMVAMLLLEQLAVEHPAAPADVPCWAGALDAIPDEADPSYDMADDAVPGTTIAPFDVDAAVLLDRPAEPVLQPEPEQPDVPHVAPVHPDDPDAADAPLDEDAPDPLEYPVVYPYDAAA